MKIHQLKSLLRDEQFQAVILSYADSNHYLVGAEDKQNNYFLLQDEKGKTKQFNSVREAENALVAIGIEQANFIIETAYDEMIGRERCQAVSTSISLHP